jgi:hypothetical protein
VPDSTLSLPLRARRERSAPPPPRRERRLSLARVNPWATVAVLIVAAAAAWVVLTGQRPAYDAYGWLDWGRQAAHLKLDTSAAPSWKPLTFLFTFPYALVLGRAALFVWMVTAAVGTFSAPVLAGRIAYRLSGAASGRRWAALGGAVLAGLGILGIEGWWHEVLISTSDPMVVALCLGAVDCALSRRAGWAWLLLVLATLGRPEALPAMVVYGVWAWRAVPSLRVRLVAGAAAIPLLWFGIPALTSESWFVAGKVLGDSTKPLVGNKLVDVLDEFVHLYELPMQIAALVAVGVAVALRLRTWLLVVAAAVSWLVVEIALAYHGWGVSPRYMFAPAALMVALVGAGAGRLLSLRRGPLIVSWLSLAAVIALVATMVPHARIRARLAHNGIVLGHRWARGQRRLDDVIRREGGAKRILACGQPVTVVPWQSILAWDLDENVIDVGWKPPSWVSLKLPIVLFIPHDAGWHVHALNATTTPAQVREALQDVRTNDGSVASSVRKYFSRPEFDAASVPAYCGQLDAWTPQG